MFYLQISLASVWAKTKIQRSERWAVWVKRGEIWVEHGTILSTAAWRSFERREQTAPWVSSENSHRSRKPNFGQRTMIMKIYQMLNYCRAVYNTTRKDFTTMATIIYPTLQWQPFISLQESSSSAPLLFKFTLTVVQPYQRQMCMVMWGLKPTLVYKGEIRYSLNQRHQRTIVPSLSSHMCEAGMTVGPRKPGQKF